MAKKCSESKMKRTIKIHKTTGEILEVFNSQLEAAASLGIHQCNISDAIRGRQATAGGYKWKFE